MQLALPHIEWHLTAGQLLVADEDGILRLLAFGHLRYICQGLAHVEGNDGSTVGEGSHRGQHTVGGQQGKGAVNVGLVITCSP